MADDVRSDVGCAWRLTIREPRGGKMFPVLNHNFATLPDAVDHIAEFTRRFAGTGAYGLMVFEDGFNGVHFCAWPFFGDLRPASPLEFPAILEAFRAVGIELGPTLIDRSV